MQTKPSLWFHPEHNELMSALQLTLGTIRFDKRKPHWVCTLHEARNILHQHHKNNMIDAHALDLFFRTYGHNLAKDYDDIATRVKLHEIDWHIAPKCRHTYRMLTCNKISQTALSGDFIGFPGPIENYHVRSFERALWIMVAAVALEQIDAPHAISLLQQAIGSGLSVTEPPKIFSVDVYPRTP